ncbi:MAG: flagellar biosynthesis anti-sigma factor FlgM [Gemmatimonadaceae bacterium]|nr:flagellar biosynthesis anti-sigma factor FlgM [Gemmatimonadaceae bacterium]
MKINGPNTPITPASLTRDVRDAGQTPARQKPADVDTQRTTPRDSVSISAEARKLAEAQGSESTLSAERAAEIKKKILEGAYNSADMAGKVAERILKSGDV